MFTFAGYFRRIYVQALLTLVLPFDGKSFHHELKHNSGD